MAVLTKSTSFMSDQSSAVIANESTEITLMNWFVGFVLVFMFLNLAKRFTFLKVVFLKKISYLGAVI